MVEAVRFGARRSPRENLDFGHAAAAEVLEAGKGGTASMSSLA